MRPDERAFVSCTWRKSYAPERPRYSDIGWWASGHSAVVSSLIDTSYVAVATMPELPDEIIAWVCMDPIEDILHYAYVRGPYRRRGIGTMLVKVARATMGGEDVCCSHMTKRGHLMKIPWLKFDPWVLASRRLK